MRRPGTTPVKRGCRRDNGSRCILARTGHRHRLMVSASLTIDELVDAGALLKEGEPMLRRAEVMPVGTIAAKAARLQSIGAESC